MRKAWPLWLLMLLAAVVLPVSLSACSNNSSPDDGGSGDDANDGTDQDGDGLPPNRVLKFSLPMSVDQDQAGLQLDLVATPDNQFAIAYFKQGIDNLSCATDANCTDDPPQAAEWSCINTECVPVCTEPILGDDEVPVQTDWLRYAWYDGSTWNHEDVTAFASVLLSGIELVFDGSTPTVVFMGESGSAAGGRQVCGGNDVMVGRRTGPSNWDMIEAVATSDQATAGADCPKMQSICDFGDVVGLWPSVAVAPDGTIGIAYRDIHNGYTKEAQDSSDLEFTWAGTGGAAWSQRWIDLARGSGLFNALAFDADSNPVVAFYNGKYGMLTFDRLVDDAFNGTVECASQADCPDGLECIQSTGWCWNVIARPAQAMQNASISMVVAPDGRYLVAYFDPDEKNLMLAQSADGLDWQTSIIDSDGSTGLFPSLLIDPQSGMPMVAYYRCSDYRPGELNCNPNQDGARLAIFSGEWPGELIQQNKWKKNQDLIDMADSASLEGSQVELAVTADGKVGIAYNYSWVDPVDSSSHQAVMFRQGTWEEE